ncbi:MAG: ATP:cob(I)alamin adenosyltransferase, partial [Acidimicrobiia bacterium]
MKIYTRRGDDGTTGLLYGGRVRKDDPRPEAYGAVDEAQAFVGLARAEARAAGRDELDAMLVRIERDLWVVMAELATAPERRDRL